MRPIGWLGLILVLLGVGLTSQQEEVIPHDEVRVWALKFGVDLWEFGRFITKMSDIQRRYRMEKAAVNKKDGLVLAREMAAEVRNMMDFKMNAVMKLMENAEQAAVSVSREGAASPPKYYASHRLNLITDDGKLSVGSREVNLKPNRHFDHVSVNLSLSAVLMPPGVKDTESDVASGLQWSEYLDALFVNNYESDPTLSWQYFGSTSGFLRRFPAISWPPVDTSPTQSGPTRVRDVDDFRLSEWFVGGATSPKDLAILVDGSSLSSGKTRRLVIATVNAILDSLGPNDFVNVYRYSEEAEEIVTCFKDIMLAASPHMPVRLFTYLVGGDNSQELHTMSCNNKGFYARITNMEEIKSKVFEYIKVLARPMVLYQRDHPIHWTPVYIGGKSSRYGLEGQGQLMTSVTAPILDRRNHTVRTGNLLGIVGTDVPINQIQKLVPPYKLGVNGYSFLVDNNGRVLYHPDLRPLPGNSEYEETLKRKFISVDLSEVELSENDGPMHSLNNTLLLDLRHDMIDQKEGETEFPVKIHYDDMKRVTIRRYNYFYTPIKDTPFSLGLALPEGYGMFELHAEKELRHAKVNVTEFFKGNNWKVHPDWTYCEYYFESDKWFATPEDRVLHFLTQAHNPGWKWRSMRPKSPGPHQKPANKPDKDSYFCDKGLLQSLVLDAWVTEEFDKRIERPMQKNDKKNMSRFEVARSFVATRSGLLRWHDYQQDKENKDFGEPNFAEIYRRSMDSIWYKRAVDQHSIEPESFVFSVPFDAADNPRPLVTATHAIFVENQGHKTPAAVVGIQFQHSSLTSHFVNITSACGNSCKKNCASDELDCYILDNNGFVIISEKHEHTGKFFGDIDGTIMDSLVQDEIFRNISVTDYQGVCSPQSSHVSAAPKVSSYSIMKTIAAFSNFMWTWTVNLNLVDALHPVWAYASDSEDDANVVYPDNDNYPPDVTDEVTLENEDLPLYPPIVKQPVIPTTSTHSTTTNIPPQKLRICEKKTVLYILQPDKLSSTPLKAKLTNCHMSGCERPFSVQKISHTNLILLVADTLCPCGSKKLGIRPYEALSEPGACTARRERLYRRRPSKCINYHPEEQEIKVCGGASTITGLQFGLLLVSLLIAHLT